MISAPTGWNELYNARDTHMEIKIVINDNDEYYTGDLASGDCKISHRLFDAFSFGNCQAAELTVTLMPDNQISIPDGIISIKPYVRLTDKYYQTPTDWIPQGTFWIDTTEYDLNGNLGITAFDTMILTEQDYFQNGTAPDGDTWPKSAASVVSYICTKLGCELDARSTIPNIQISSPDYKTMREVLSEIATVAAANWTFTKQGKLRLVQLTGNISASCEDISVSDLRLTSQPTQIGQVILRASDSVKYSSGSETGYTVEGTYSGATQELADDLLSACSSVIYQGTTTNGAWFSPLLELGDPVSSSFTYENGTTEQYYYMFDSYDCLYEEGCSGVVESPLSTAVDHRIRFSNSQPSKTSQAIKQACAETLEEAKKYTDQHGGSGDYIATRSGTGYNTQFIGNIDFKSDKTLNNPRNLTTTYDTEIVRDRVDRSSFSNDYKLRALYMPFKPSDVEAYGNPGFYQLAPLIIPFRIPFPTDINVWTYSSTYKTYEYELSESWVELPDNIDILGVSGSIGIQSAYPDQIAASNILQIRTKGYGISWSYSFRKSGDYPLIKFRLEIPQEALYTGQQDLLFYSPSDLETTAQPFACLSGIIYARDELIVPSSN